MFKVFKNGRMVAHVQDRETARFVALGAWEGEYKVVSQEGWVTDEIMKHRGAKCKEIALFGGKGLYRYA